MLAADLDKEIFSADSALELVIKLKDNPWTWEQSPSEYMEKFAHRAKLAHGALVRYDTPENFLSDLLAASLLVIVDGKP